MRFSICASIVVLFLSFVLFSCARQEAEKMDITQVRKAIEETNTKWIEAFNRGDVSALVQFYTEDATILPPRSEMVKGSQQIQEFFKSGMEMGIIDISLTTIEVNGSDDTAYEIGKYSLTVQPEGQEAVTDTGKYVVVWKRQADGTWKLQVDIWNTSVPMPK